jgi:hypothetical protein
MFGNPDYYFQTSGTPDFVENPGFAWNHGGLDHKVNTTWLGMVGPGVERHGIDEATWSDHTDIRPTMLLLAGLTDDYAHDGRALVENLSARALPKALGGESALAFRVLAAAYKQINAPVGQLGLDTLAASTAALAGDDATYAAVESQLSTLTTKRDALAAKIIQQLEDAEFNGKPVDPLSTLGLVAQAEELLAAARALKH